MSSFKLSAVLRVWGSVALLAHAAPQGGFVPTPIVSFRNTTTTANPALPTVPSCANTCSVEYPRLKAVQWVPASQVVYTERIAVATVFLFVTILRSSSFLPAWSETAQGYVPPQYDLYSTTVNNLGTAEVAFPITFDEKFTSWTVLAYPSQHVDYEREYQWQGMLETHKEADIGCATATDQAEPVSLPWYTLYPQTKPPYPQTGDQFGVDYVPLWVPHTEQPSASFFSTAFPKENAFRVCESVPLELKGTLTIYSAVEFYTVTSTVYTSAAVTEGVIIIQPTASGWDDIHDSPVPPGPPTFTPPTAEAPHLEQSTDGWGELPPWQTARPEWPTSGEELPPWQTVNPEWPSNPDPNSSPNLNVPAQPQKSPSNRAENSDNGGGNDGPRPPQTPGSSPPESRPTFTLLPTVIGGRQTTVPAFIIPGTGSSLSTAAIGQTVTMTDSDGQPSTTVLSAPQTFFTFLPATTTGADGTATTLSKPVYIISGTSTASLGQTVTIDGTTSVLEMPSMYTVMVSTTVGGTQTELPAMVSEGKTSILDAEETGSVDGGFSGPEETDAPESGASIVGLEMLQAWVLLVTGGVGIWSWL